MKLSDNKHKLTCFVIMTLFPFYKNMLQFSVWSCSYKMRLYWPNFSLVFLIHLFLHAGVYCIASSWNNPEIYARSLSCVKCFHCIFRGRANRGSKRRANSMRWSYFSSEKGLFTAPYFPLRLSGSRYGRPSWFQRVSQRNQDGGPVRVSVRS